MSSFLQNTSIQWSERGTCLECFTYLLTNWLAYLYGRIQSPRPDVMHGPRKLSSYHKTLVLIFYCLKNQLVFINIFKTDIPRQREEYEVIYGMRRNAHCHITSILRAGVEYLLNIKTSVFMHGPIKLSSYYKTLVLILIFYCSKNKLVLINIFKTDIQRQ